MKKILLFLSLCTLGAINTNAQNTNISFETTEGYTLGNLVGQNNWEIYGSVNNGYAQVVNTIASHGTNSANVLSNDELILDGGGIFYNLPITENYSVSADVLFEDIDGSDYQMLALYNADYDIIATFYFDYEGNIILYANNDEIEYGNWIPNTWYNLKIDYDTTNQNIKMYFNNTLVHTASINAEVAAPTEVDFEFDNYFTGFNIDNFKITSLENNLSTLDVNKISTSIFPNPTTDYIQVNSKEEIKSLTVLDLTGKVLTNKKNDNSINVENLSKGVYLLKITTEKGSETQKFIKN